MGIRIKRYDDNDHLVETLKTLTADDFTITPDDRLELVPVIGGVTITDGGRYTNGDKRTVTVIVDAATYNKIKTIWTTREIVDVVFPDNETVTNAIVIVRQVVYADKLHSKYKKLQLEIWKGNNLVDD